MANNSEEWRDILGYEGIYQVSNLGAVKRIASGQGTQMGLLKPSTAGAGYLSVQLSRENKAKRFTIHRLVATAFIGNPAPGLEACHADDDKTNNRAENLRWDTHSENHLDITRNGNRPTHCKRGHEYTEDNIYITSRGHKECKMCRRTHQQARTNATRERLHGKKF